MLPATHLTFSFSQLISLFPALTLWLIAIPVLPADRAPIWICRSFWNLWASSFPLKSVVSVVCRAMTSALGLERPSWSSHSPRRNCSPMLLTCCIQKCIIPTLGSPGSHSQPCQPSAPHSCLSTEHCAAWAEERKPEPVWRPEQLREKRAIGASCIAAETRGRSSLE